MNIFSAFMSGFVLAKPVMEIKTIYENRGRVLISGLFAAAAFVFLMCSILLSTAEILFQYEDQGFLVWSTMLTLSALFLVFCGISALAASFIFPRAPAAVAPQLQETLHKILQGLANQFPAEKTETSAVAREIHEVAEEREKIRRRPRGDLDLDQAATPAFTH